MTDVEAIKEKLDIVEVIRGYIPLQQAGKNLKAPCPFHKEKTASFVVSPDRQTWHCFGQCNEGGDVISFVMKYENVEFYEALRALAEKAGIELKKINPKQEQEFGVLYEVHEAAIRFFESQYHASQEAKNFLLGRGIKEETREEFRIGFAPNERDGLLVHLVNTGFSSQDIERAGLAFKTERGTYMDRFRGRIMFPLRNTFGKTVAFSGRILPQYDSENTGKYINSPESQIFSKSRLLFAYDMAKQHIKNKQKAIVVEGQMDCCMLFQEGVRNTVATSGTALTQSHLQTMRKVTDSILFAFDTDEAGQLATERAIDMAHMLDFSARVFSVQGAKDAAEFIQKNPSKIEALIEHESQDAFSFYTRRFLEMQYKNDIKKGIRAFLQKVLHILSPVDRTMWMQRLAKETRMPEQVIFDELEMAKKNMRPESQKDVSSTTATPESRTRIETLLLNVLQMCMTHPNLTSELEAYAAYVPEAYAPYFKKCIDPSFVLEERQQQVYAMIEMKSATDTREMDEEKNRYEVRMWLREIKKEFITVEMNKKLAHIRKLEQEDAKEEISKVLKEFDELAKLRDNSA